MFILTIFVIVAELSIIHGSVYDNAQLHCHASGVHYYEQIGCVPKYAKCGGCPLSYKCCGDGTSAPSTCKIAGKVYNDTDTILGTSPCLFCSCFAEKDKPGSMACAMPKCFVPQVNETCRVAESIHKCCPQDIICDSDCNAKCLVDGTVYEEGMTFEPKNTCLRCICNKDFNGKYKKPNCVPKPCDLYFHFHQKFTENPNLFTQCAPIYSKWDMCCPVDFLCDVPVKVEVAKDAKNVKEDAASKCRIGKREFIKGAKFSYSHKEDNDQTHTVTCECVLPPLMTCQKDD